MCFKSRPLVFSPPFLIRLQLNFFFFLFKIRSGGAAFAGQTSIIPLRPPLAILLKHFFQGELKKRHIWHSAAWGDETRYLLLLLFYLKHRLDKKNQLRKKTVGIKWESQIFKLPIRIIGIRQTCDHLTIFYRFLVLADVKKMAVMVLNELMSDINMYICLPALRNSLSEDIRVAKSVESFNSLPKTHFYRWAFMRNTPLLCCRGFDHHRRFFVSLLFVSPLLCVQVSMKVLGLFVGALFQQSFPPLSLFTF